jgi:hypothetical protein
MKERVLKTKSFRFAVRNIILLLSLIALLACCTFFIFAKNTPMKKGKVTIWTMMRTYLADDTERTTWFVLEDGCIFLKKCSPEVKIIVAFYIKQHLETIVLLVENNEMLVNALGNYSTLNEAVETLLKNKEHYFKDVKTEHFPNGIDIEVDEEMVRIIFADNRWKGG